MYLIASSSPVDRSYTRLGLQRTAVPHEKGRPTSIPRL